MDAEFSALSNCVNTKERILLEMEENRKQKRSFSIRRKATEQWRRKF